ncbi:short-chain dehydrogenase TIC 32, chloroplastic-like [Solanum pennellii]|uniref:Short-chain dehydrogenase TIC 32, chloroplastic-like n=1 Tax=Solanum pennellii TaxID=28526 RepID=A0ABM1GYW1_SOLPN|nr:short-chain dehydrogenase TIC 32, chloroplastic-like [Solanum pennellii]
MDFHKVNYKAFIYTCFSTISAILQFKFLSCDLMKATLKYLAGIAGASGYGSKTTAEQVTQVCSVSFSSQLTAIITGATSGIGAETARILAKRGVRLVIPARDLKKAAILKETIKKHSPWADIILLEIDLSSFASIQRFCAQFLSLGLPLHILINNAGKFSQKLEFSEDKFELSFATNYLGHFLLTEMLLDKMVETAEQTGIEGRIVNVSSVVHNWVKRDEFCFSQMLNPKKYNGTRAYAQSKLANILHAKELSRQLKARNANVAINAVHPGIVKTGITRDHKGFITDSLYFMASKLLKSTSQGAASTCYVALNPQTRGVNGKYFADCNECHCSALANDEIEAHKLWKHTRALIHRRFFQERERDL